MGDANKPVNIQQLRSDTESVRIEGDLYRLAASIQRRLASPEATDVEYVVRLAISLLHEAVGKEITFTDPQSGEFEEYRLWRP
jgi:hypothetical protein